MEITPTASTSPDQGIPSPITSVGAESLSVHANHDTRYSSSHQCSICSRRYERLDHLKRHELSHQNPRHHACPRCPRRFNRRDLLSRHIATHDPSGKDGPKPRGMERAVQACGTCIAAKTKCSNQRPCQRCQSKGIPCINGAPRRRGRGIIARLTENEPISQAEANTGNDDDESDTELTGQSVVRPSSVTGAVSEASIPEAPSGMPGLSNYQANLSLNTPNDLFVPPLDLSQISGVSHGPVSNEGFMPDIDLNNFALPMDIFSMYQDSEFRFDDTLQSLYSEPFLTTLSDEVVFPPQAALDGNPNNDQITSPSTTNQSDLSRARTMGYEAFKKSPWLWTPANQDHAYAEGKQLSVDEEQIMQSAELSHPKQPLFRAPKMRDASSRDEMLSMVLKFSTSSLKIRSFPSFNLLNLLMQAFFVRQNDSSDSWIHIATFDPDKCRSELLAGLVAAGSTLFAVPNVWKMGLALQEIVRLAACSSVDEDNRLIRDLQVNQTFLMWIEIGLWSGFRRKMEIGEGFAHTLPTMLRRAGAFRQGYYMPSCIPDTDDDGVILKEKWHRWVEQESFKRLVLRLLINEMRSSIAFSRGPVWSGLEISFCLPAARDLWDAKSPEEWKARYLSKPKRSVSVTLSEAICDVSKLRDVKDVIDVSFAALVILSMLWGRVWSYVDSKAFSLNYTLSSSRGSGNLWMEAHKQELLKHIRTTTLKLEWMRAISSEARLISESLLMSLFISPDEVQRFAGRYGDEEVLHALPRLREWLCNEDKSYALWHAGQVIRAARSYPPTQLSGFHAIAVYHACLCFWMFTVLKHKIISSRVGSPIPEAQTTDQRIVCPSNQAADVAPTSKNPERSTQETNANKAETHVNSNNVPKILLDGEDSNEVQMFLQTGYGRPFLHIGDGFEELDDPGMIFRLITDVFRGNFPSKSHPLPPLLENLAGLMKDLSNLQYM